MSVVLLLLSFLAGWVTSKWLRGRLHLDQYVAGPRWGYYAFHLGPCNYHCLGLGWYYLQYETKYKHWPL
jgi:hypothetical protein